MTLQLTFADLSVYILPDIFKYLTDIRERVRLELVNKNFGHLLPLVTEQLDKEHVKVKNFDQYLNLIIKSKNLKELQFAQLMKYFSKSIEPDNDLAGHDSYRVPIEILPRLALEAPK